MPRKPIFRASQWLLLAITILIVTAAPVNAQDNRHIVQPGENLFRIALRYGLTVNVLAQANGLSNPNHVYVGQSLVIPSGDAAAPVASAPPAEQPAATTPVYHIVQRGETLGIISQRYGVRWGDIVANNAIANPNHILVGQRLVIMSAAGTSTGSAATPPVESAPVEVAPPAPAATQTHVVQRGEYLSSIARRYGVSWTVIASANNIWDPNRVLAGQTLIIPGGSGAAQTFMEPSTGQPTGPTPTITTGKQIIVDLSDQVVYAYQDGTLLRTVIASTGLPGTPTVQGDFNIFRKLDSQTMSGPGYYLPGVPWVMYFYAGYALHGTYWHNNFGHPMSHGCVNLPTDQALWFYNWAEVGTPVRVIY